MGCNRCPCCDETIMIVSDAIRLGYGLKRGISSYTIEVPVKESWFRETYKTVTRYSCNRCGAEWESDPY